MYDKGLSDGLAGLDLGAGATLTDFDLYAFNANILANAAALGFTNTTDRMLQRHADELRRHTLDAHRQHRQLRLLGRRFIRPPGSTPCGPRALMGARSRFPSPRPGRCCSSALAAWALPDIVAASWLARRREASLFGRRKAAFGRPFFRSAPFETGGSVYRAPTDHRPAGERRGGRDLRLPRGTKRGDPRYQRPALVRR